MKTLGPVQRAQWERAVVATDFFGSSLSPHRILAIHDCHIVPTDAVNAPLVLARVAGFDTAVYGLPQKTLPLLFEYNGRLLVATTSLSRFVTARSGPTAPPRSQISSTPVPSSPSATAPIPGIRRLAFSGGTMYPSTSVNWMATASITLPTTPAVCSA